MTGGPSSRRGRWRAASVAVVAALTLALAGCGADPLAEQYRAGDNKGFVAGEFATTEIPPSDRGAPVEFSGTTDAGTDVSNADYAGQVVVINFWYAACAPCRQEAPRLEEALESFEGQDVAFLGVNTYDQPATAQSFAQEFGVTYPSIIDVNDKTVTRAFAREISIAATPTTLVLDRQGRVSSRIIGELPSASILEALVRTALEEQS